METERCLFETKDLLIVPDAPCPEKGRLLEAENRPRLRPLDLTLNELTAGEASGSGSCGAGCGGGCSGHGGCL